jgi:hypothetical protein
MVNVMERANKYLLMDKCMLAIGLMIKDMDTVLFTRINYLFMLEIGKTMNIQGKAL